MPNSPSAAAGNSTIQDEGGGCINGNVTIHTAIWLVNAPKPKQLHVPYLGDHRQIFIRSVFDVNEVKTLENQLKKKTRNVTVICLHQFRLANRQGNIQGYIECTLIRLIANIYVLLREHWAFSWSTKQWKLQNLYIQNAVYCRSLSYFVHFILRFTFLSRIREIVLITPTKENHKEGSLNISHPLRERCLNKNHEHDPR